MRPTKLGRLKLACEKETKNDDVCTLKSLPSMTNCVGVAVLRQDLISYFLFNVDVPLRILLVV